MTACGPTSLQVDMAEMRPHRENVGPQVLMEIASLPRLPHACASRAANSSSVYQQDPRVRIRI
jgi:hypothetical protein